MNHKPALVFQTDFGYKETSVSAMYGVIKNVDSDLELIEASHELPQFDIWSASYRLFQQMRFWPQGTIFVSVVDPGVGTSRRACVALTENGYYIVTPDNGSLTHVLRHHGIRQVRQIDETINRLHNAGTDETVVFHGRDLFGYCAARLGAGIITYEEVGPEYPVSEIVTFDIPEPEETENGYIGIIEIDDTNFGNLFTNIPTKGLLKKCPYGSLVHVTVREKGELRFSEDVRFDLTFGKVNPGDPIVYNNEQMKAGLAVSVGSFVKKYGIGFGPDWTVEINTI